MLLIQPIFVYFKAAFRMLAGNCRYLPNPIFADMKTTRFHLTALLGFVLLFSSCVAQKEYDALMSVKNGLETDKATLEEQLDIANEKLTRLEVQVDNLTKDKQALQADFDVIDKELKDVK